MTLEGGLTGNHNILQDIDPYTPTSGDIKRIFFQDRPDINEWDITNNILETTSYDVLAAMGMIDPTNQYKQKIQADENTSIGGKQFDLFYKKS